MRGEGKDGAGGRVTSVVSSPSYKAREKRGERRSIAPPAGKLEGRGSNPIP